MSVNTTSVRNNLILQVMFCMSERALQDPHYYLIGMHKIRYGPARILFFTLALIVSHSNDSDLQLRVL